MSSPIKNSNDFYILGMNLGANQRDYTMLHERPKIADNENLQSLLEQYKNPAFKEQSGKIEEKIFFILINEPSLSIDSSDKELITLILEKGLDILESNLDNEKVKQLISQNSEQLFTVLKDRIKDKYGAQQFRKIYPKLTQHLIENYNKELPKHLRLNFLEKLIAFIQQHIRKKPLLESLGTPVERQFQSVKDRLAKNFFSKVINSPDKPAVITLQEVQRSNQGVLDVLNEGHYTILRPDNNSDTAIALDTHRFEEYKEFYSQESDTICVWAKDKTTQEQFIFVSVHVPGYKLEIPDNASEEELKTLFQAVEGNLEFSTLESLKQLNRFLEELKNTYPEANIVIQGDFNTYPEYFDHPLVTSKVKDLNIFSYLKNKNLTLFRTNQPTELNRLAPSLHERELDYVFASKNLENRVKPISPEDQELSLAKIKAKEVHFDPMLLFSDHRPMWMKITGKNL